jgi:hypothetical protein
MQPLLNKTAQAKLASQSERINEEDGLDWRPFRGFFASMDLMPHGPPSICPGQILDNPHTRFNRTYLPKIFNKPTNSAMGKAPPLRK